MPEPMVEQIRSNVKSTIAEITTGNGWDWTVEVESPGNMGEGNRPRDGLVILYQLDPQESDRQPLGKKAWIQPFAAAMFVVGGGASDPADLDTKINRRRSDVEKKILEDRSRNSLAVDTVIRPPFTFEEETGSFSGIMVMFDVEYRTDEDDPYVQG